MYIGKLHIENPLCLAPMAGITDHPFRILCREMGAGIVYSEFVSANGIIRENVKTLKLMNFTEDERPIGIQIFGEKPDIVGRSALMINNLFNPDIIDINFGCPVPKVTKRGAGSAALKNLSLMYEITGAVIEAVPNIPVTVKMRAGWDNDNLVSTEAGIRLENIGVAAITLHARTTGQQFTGEANWQLIKDLKSAVKIPVIGNGDVKNADDYFKMKETTGCDGVMIGRAALGNPWIFKSIYNRVCGKPDYIPELSERIKMCRRHFTLLQQDKNDHICVNLAKKHFSYYLKGFNGASSWRKNFMRSTNPTEINQLLNDMQKEYSN